MYYKTIILCCAATLAFGFCSCAKQEQPVVTTNNETPSETIAMWEEGTDGVDPKKKGADSPNLVKEDLPEFDMKMKPNKINKANIFNKDEPLVYNDFTFKNFSVKMSKSLPEGLKKTDLCYISEYDSMDENGTLTGSQTYAFVTMDITNNTDKANDLYLNSSNFIVLDENYSFTTYIDDTRYRSGTPTDYIHGYFKQKFNSNETLTFTIGYILSDASVNSDMLFFAAKSGSVDKNTKVYKIN